jgi:hypothetical protein
MGNSALCVYDSICDALRYQVKCDCNMLSVGGFRVTFLLCTESGVDVYRLGPLSLKLLSGYFPDGFRARLDPGRPAVKVRAVNDSQDGTVLTVYGDSRVTASGTMNIVTSLVGALGDCLRRIVETDAVFDFLSTLVAPAEERGADHG